MKILKYLIIVFAILMQLTLYAQQQTKIGYRVLRSIISAQKKDQELSVFVKGDIYSVKSIVESLGGTYKYGAGDISVIRIPAGNIYQLADNTFVKRIETGSRYVEPLNDRMVINNNVI